MTAWKPTACILCECNCGIEVRLDGGRFDRIRGDKKHPASQGYICEKPARLDYYQNNPNRLMQPLRRRTDGSFEAIDWDTAIAEIAQKLAAIRDTHGGDSIFYYGGGGQGNHLPSAYASSTRRVLQSRYKSNALAQEKTGEFLVAGKMLGTPTRGDFEHCQVGMFLGKNPWQSHSIARARVVLKDFAKDPQRTMIVVDPRVTKTARMADIHLQVRPGTDAWLLTAMVAQLFEEDLLDHTFLAEVEGVEALRAAFAGVDIGGHCKHAGLDEDLVRKTTRIIANAESFAGYEDLGVQMNRHSTVVSYLHRLLWLLTGNFGRRGTHATLSGLVRFAWGADGKQSPVVGAPIISGLVPCNVIPDEVLTDNPKRYRAMFIEAANPAHSLADGPRMREALSALEVLVVVDVAMTETAQLADYVLPASTQYEKAEATFFNFEFPHNVFHLRRAMLKPPEGPLSEAEIHTRLCEALGGFTQDDLAPLHAAAAQGLEVYALALMQQVLPNRRLAGQIAAILYRTLGPHLPWDAREGAVLLGLAARAVMTGNPAMARAGFGGDPLTATVALFRGILESTSGLVIEEREWSECVAKKAITLVLPELLEVVCNLGVPHVDPGFPFVLAAGERRAFTANTIIRNPAWRRRDAEGALRMSPLDAADVGVESGGRVRVTTRRGSVEVTVEVSDTMQRGHISLPNGLGLTFAGTEGAGVAPNELTSSDHRDPFAGTPLHKAVPARLEALVRTRA